jgi:hypothetical protein
MVQPVRVARRAAVFIVLTLLAVYLTWSHVQYWHIERLWSERVLEVPWLASIPLFRPLSAILVASAWIAVLLLPSERPSVDGLRSAVVPAGIGLMLIVTVGAFGVHYASTSAAAQYWSKDAAKNSRSAAENAAKAAENAEVAAEKAAMAADKADDAARAAENCER